MGSGTKMITGLNQYQAESRETAVYPNMRTPGELSAGGFNYALIGMCGEAGELANKYKKILRNRDFLFGRQNREILVDELGDVLWYVAAVAIELGYSLEEVANLNIEKLRARKVANQLKEHA